MSLKDNAFSEIPVSPGGSLCDMEKAMEGLLEQIKKLQEQYSQLEKDFARVKEKLKQAEMPSIPVEYMEKQLRVLPVDLAWDIFQKLNALLMENETWHKHVVDISSMLKDRMRQQELNHDRMVTYMGKMASSQKPHITMQNPRFDGPMYEIRDNETVNFETQSDD